MRRRLTRPTAALLGALLIAPALAVALDMTIQGAVPYLQAGDGFLPFGGPGQQLVTFEDGRGLPPGWRLSPGEITAPGPDTDSVDADDGLVDGDGTGGRSYRVASGAEGLTVHFDARALGGLPTQFGVVWTDGSPGGFLSMEAFDAAGQSYGWSGSGPVGDDDLLGQTAEDRLVGLDTLGLGAISRVHVWTEPGPRGDRPMEVDHLQIGGLTGWFMLGGGVAGSSAPLAPELTGQGLLEPDALATVSVDLVLPGQRGLLVVGEEATPTPLFGGVLVPSPDLVLPFQVGRLSGTWTTQVRWPAAVLDLLPLTLQAWIEDSAAPRGWAVSNTLQVGVGD